jgi:hypothetical protein
MNVSRRLSWLASPYFTTAVIGSYTSLTIRGNSLSDSFHQGEYFTSGDRSRLFNGLNQYNIHGALDWIPLSIGSSIHGNSNYFLLTVMIYQLLSLITSIVFLNLVLFLAPDHRSKRDNVLIFLVTCSSFLFLDYRELGVILVLNILLRYLRDERSLWLRFLLGIGVPFSLAWYPGRGLITLSAVLVSLAFTRSYKRAFFYTFCWILVLLFMGFLDPRLSANHIFQNILFIQNTSHIWRYKESLLQISEARLLIAAILIVFLLLVTKARKFIQANDFLFAIIFLLHASGYIVFSLNRADLQHILMSSWWLLVFPFMFKLNGLKENFFYLLVIAIQCKLFVGMVRGRPDRIFAMLIVACIIFCLAAYILLFFYRHLKGSSFMNVGVNLFFLALSIVNYGQSSLNLTTAFQGSRSNPSVVSEEIRWAGSVLKEAGAECYFDFTNQGLVAGLLEKPNCTSFNYPAYIDPTMQSRIIQELMSSSPSAILYSSPNWSSSNIDGSPMSSRLPQLDSFLLDYWKVERCYKETCARFIN